MPHNIEYWKGKRWWRKLSSLFVNRLIVFYLILPQLALCLSLSDTLDPLLPFLSLLSTIKEKPEHPYLRHLISSLLARKTTLSSDIVKWRVFLYMVSPLLPFLSFLSVFSLLASDKRPFVCVPVNVPDIISQKSCFYLSLFFSGVFLLTIDERTFPRKTATDLGGYFSP